MTRHTFHDNSTLVPYDITLLPSIQIAWDAKSHWTQHKYDIIIKRYDPSTDEFVYDRVPDVNLKMGDNQWVWMLGDGIHAVSPNVRVVAFIPHPDWHTFFKSRLDD